MALTKVEKERVAKKRLRERHKRQTLVIGGSAIATGGAWAKVEQSSMYGAIPTPFGIPKTALVALATFLGAWNTSGMLADALTGATVGLGTVASYNWLGGRTVSGDSGDLDAMQRRLEAALAGDEVAGYLDVQGDEEDEDEDDEQVVAGVDSDTLVAY
jgi:hypothetical protein